MTFFYTGSYTQKGAPAAYPTGKGIGCFHFDLETGEISFLHYIGQRNPSYLTISRDKKFLYAVEEMYEFLNPKVFAYRIGDDGSLNLLNTQKIKGDYACHLAIIQDRLVVANYVSGNALSYPILKDGRLAPYTQEIKHEGSGPNVERQASPHMHMIYPFGNDSMYVLDFSLDMAKAYHFDTASEQWIATPNLDIKIDAGSGARHMVVDQKKELAFVLGELTGDVFVVDLYGDVCNIVQKISIIPEDHRGDISGAAIRLHPNGKFLYTSNRGSGSISVFRIDRELKNLTLVANHSTEGKTPRDFNIDPSGKWLIAANQDSNSLVVFEINQNDGTLSLKAKAEAETETVVNICWL